MNTKHILLYLLCFVAFAACSTQDEAFLEVQGRASDLLDKAKANYQNPSLALEQANEAIRLMEDAEFKSISLVKAYNLKGYLLYNTQEYGDAYKAYQSALTLNTFDKDQLAYTYFQLGLTDLKLLMYQDAMIHLQVSHNMYQDQGDREWLRRVSYYLGRANLYGNNLKEALAFAEASKAYGEEAGDSKHLQLVYPLIAEIHTSLNQFVKAEAILSEMESRFDRISADKEALLAVERAYLLNAQGKFDAAATQYKKAIEIIEAHPGEVREAVAFKSYLEYGSLLESLGEKAAGIAMMQTGLEQESLDYSRPNSDLSAMYMHLVNHYEGTNDLAKANRYLRKENALRTAKAALMQEIEVLRQKEELYAYTASLQHPGALAWWQNGWVLLSIFVVLLGAAGTGFWKFYQHHQRYRRKVASSMEAFDLYRNEMAKDIADLKRRYRAGGGSFSFDQ